MLELLAPLFIFGFWPAWYFYVVLPHSPSDGKAKRWQISLRRLLYLFTACAIGAHCMPRDNTFYVGLGVIAAVVIGTGTFLLLVGAEAIYRRLTSRSR